MRAHVRRLIEFADTSSRALAAILRRVEALEERVKRLEEIARLPR